LPCGPDLDPLADELDHRTRGALTHGLRAGELGAHLPPDEVDEVRIVATYLSSHPTLAEIPLDPPPAPESLLQFARTGLDGRDLGASGR
jgi:hypothetical protein